MHNERCRERRTLVTLSRTLGLVLWGDCVHGASVLVTLSKYLEREREKGGTQWVHIVGLIFVSARTNKRHHHGTNFIGETVSITSIAFQLEGVKGNGDVVYAEGILLLLLLLSLHLPSLSLLLYFPLFGSASGTYPAMLMTPCRGRKVAREANDVACLPRSLLSVLDHLKQLLQPF